MTEPTCLIKEFHYASDGCDLLAAFKAEPFLFSLNSSQHDQDRGRFSFLGFAPFKVISHRGRESLARVKEEFEQYGQEINIVQTPFPTGAVGFLSYDYGLSLEKIKLQDKEELNIPDCVFGFYDVVITIDHWAKKIFVTSTGLPLVGAQREKKAQDRLEHVSQVIENTLVQKSWFPSEVEDSKDSECKIFKSNTSGEAFIRSVQKALDYIKKGDIYQVNISQCFEYAASIDKAQAIDIYQRLAIVSPSSFSAYFDAGDLQVMSSSPELFLRVRKGVVSTRPMKGTRPRGKTPAEDSAYRSEMLNSVKEKAELLMVTDLLRNDLGRVCDYGSVKVKEMRALEEYKNIFQATSTIEGTLRKDKDCFDLIEACFPGGSVTGCPKIRAMEIIEELEPSRRGVYTGSLGYISFSGNMDLNILIRTIVAAEDKVYFQVGSGIVADSQPEAEYEETLLKAEAMRVALSQAFSVKSSI